MVCRSYNFCTKHLINQRRFAHAGVSTDENANSPGLFDINGLPLIPEDIFGKYRTSQSLDVAAKWKILRVKKHVAIFVVYQVYRGM